MPHDPLALPEFTAWPTFPFEGDLRIKALEEPVEVEPPRQGEDPSTCHACQAPDLAYIWVSDRWRVRALDRPTGLPMVLILESRSHLDLGDLPNLLAAELGVMTVRLERAIRSIEGVARVHVNRWGDGSAHLHLWFLARPYGRLQLRGTFLSLWDDILPPVSEARWRENLGLVAAWLAEFGGRPLAEPAPIDWQAPARLDERAGSSIEGPVEEAETAARSQRDVRTGPEPAVDEGPEPTAEEVDTRPFPGDEDAGAGPRLEIDPVDDPVMRVPPPTADASTDTTGDGDGAAAGATRAGADESDEPHGARRARGLTSDTGPDGDGATKEPRGSADGPTTRRRAPRRAAASGASRPAPDPADPEDAWEEGV